MAALSHPFPACIGRHAGQVVVRSSDHSPGGGCLPSGACARTGSLLAPHRFSLRHQVLASTSRTRACLTTLLVPFLPARMAPLFAASDNYATGKVDQHEVNRGATGSPHGGLARLLRLLWVTRSADLPYSLDQAQASMCLLAAVENPAPCIWNNNTRQ